MQHAVAGAAVEVGDRVAYRLGLQVPDMGLAAGVGQHLEHVGLRPAVGLVGHLPRSLLRPQRLPSGLDLLGVVAKFRHAAEASTRPVMVYRLSRSWTRATAVSIGSRFPRRLR